jgi:N-acetylglucosaminyl-diphospho-decaprenol L-rhamnosyltransferase
LDQLDLERDIANDQRQTMSDLGLQDEQVDVSVIVVTHQSAGQILSCLASLETAPPRRSYELIVVDNASTDGTPESVARAYPGALLVKGTRRQGFAANCNAGAALARGQVLMFLNPDARVTNGSVDTLVTYLNEHRDIGIVGAKLVFPDGSHQASARRFPDPWSTLVRRTPLRWLLRHSAGERHHLMLDDHLDQPVLVDWVLGAAMAVPTQLFRRLGGMDERYRLYCEDIDLCWRSWKAGFPVAYVPTTVIEHDLSELTRRKFMTRATLWHVRGMAHFARQHGFRKLRPILYPIEIERQ